jgi:transporter family-2 protein
MDIAAIIVALVCGTLLSLQVGMNFQLKQATGHPLWAAIISFLVGLGALLMVTAALRPPAIPWGKMGNLPWWAWLGGTMGAVYVTAATVLAPRLGAATLTALVVTGQLAATILIDHFGLVGYAVHPVTILRVVGAVMLCAGAVLVLKF